MAAEIATHDAPAWRDKANFLIFADLSTTGMVGRWEQLWAQQASDDEFVICCIPYFAYGLALGDKVRTAASASKKYVETGVVARSGHRAFRLWLKDATPDARARVLKYVERYTPVHEWSSDNLLVVDVPEREPSPAVVALLDDLTRTSIRWEWSD